MFRRIVKIGDYYCVRKGFLLPVTMGHNGPDGYWWFKYPEEWKKFTSVSAAEEFLDKKKEKFVKFI